MFTQHRGKRRKNDNVPYVCLKQQRFSRTQVESQKDITIKLSARARQKCIHALGLAVVKRAIGSPGRLVRTR